MVSPRTCSRSWPTVVVAIVVLLTNRGQDVPTTNAPRMKPPEDEPARKRAGRLSPIPVQLWRAYRVNDALVEAWAHDHGLELTDGNRPIVARYLRRAQVARTWGGIAGVIVPSVIDLGVA